ncbi:MAG: hypothetical protein APF76_03200 [Desulfitibacter sp. BRH_c19]|nr:MAG: hypothetical protein APF76_03200 [Desulfitibacter sp. BRH_c19]
MIILQCNNLSKSFGVDNIFEEVSLVINQGEKVGLVGPNGVGKSTLLKGIVGEESVDKGVITFGKGIRVAYLPQSTSILEGDKPLLDYVLEEYQDLLKLRQEIHRYQTKMSLPEVYNDSKKLEEVMTVYSSSVELYEREGGYSFESKIRGVLIGLGFQEDDFTRTLSTFSGGQKTRISLAKILIRNPELLILDEPTNYLDLKSVEWLEGYLVNYVGTILLVSHDRYFLDQVTTVTLDLRKSGIESYPGGYSRYLILKQQRQEANRKEYEKQQDHIERQEDYIRKYKAGIKSKQARGRQSILSRLERVERPDDYAKTASIKFRMETGTGEKVLEAKNLSMEYPGNLLFKNIDINIWKGEKVALIGDNGTGKTTLLKMLAGRISGSGEIRFGSRVKTAFFTQEHEDLNLDNTVMEELWLNPRMTENEVRSVLGRFLFSGDSVEKKVSSLSGGERSRLMLAKLFLQNANLLILDEPTNHLDIQTREVLEEALIEFPGNLLFVSHDRYFINKLATRVLELEERNIKEYLGDFDYYRWKKREAELDEEAKLERNKVVTKKVSKAKPTNLKEKWISVEEIEKQIEVLEEELGVLGEKLGDTELYSNPQEVRKCTEGYKQIEDQLAELYQKWEEKV